METKSHVFGYMPRIVTSLRSSLAMVKYQKRWGMFLILIKWGLWGPCLSQTQGPHLIQWQLGFKIKAGLRGTSIHTCLDGRAFDLAALLLLGALVEPVHCALNMYKIWSRAYIPKAFGLMDFGANTNTCFPPPIQPVGVHFNLKILGFLFGNT